MSRTQRGPKPILWSLSELANYAGNDAMCVTLTSQEIAAILAVTTQQMTWDTRWFDAPPGFGVSFANTLTDKLLASSKCVKKPRSGLPFDFWWRDDGYEITIYEDCAMPVTVNIYDNCCGDGGASGSGGTGGAVTGGTGASLAPVSAPASSTSSKCDLATSLVPYFVAQCAEFLTSIDTFVESGTPLIDAFLVSAVDLLDPTGVTPNLLEEAINLLNVQLDPLINAFQDSDLLLSTQRNWWGRVGDGRASTMTRNDAIAIGQSLPVAWNVISVSKISSPRLFGEIFGRFCDLNKLTNQAFIARGTANDALCEYLASANDDVYTPPNRFPESSTDEILAEVVSGSSIYRLYKVFDDVVIAGDANTQNIDVATIRTAAGQTVAGLAATVKFNEPFVDGSSGGWYITTLEQRAAMTVIDNVSGNFLEVGELDKQSNGGVRYPGPEATATYNTADTVMPDMFAGILADAVVSKTTNFGVGGLALGDSGANDLVLRAGLLRVYPGQVVRFEVWVVTLESL